MTGRLELLNALGHLRGLSKSPSVSSQYLVDLGKKASLVKCARGQLASVVSSRDFSSRQVLGALARAAAKWVSPVVAENMSDDYGIDRVVTEVIPGQGERGVPAIWLASAGTAGPEQKLHLIVFDANACPEFHLKLGIGAAAHSRIAHEVRTVRSLGDRIPLPSVVGLKEVDGRTVSAMRFLQPARSVRFREMAPLLAKLREVGERTLISIPAIESAEHGLRHLPKAYECDADLILDSWRSVLDSASNLEFACAFVHGDFAPWNVRSRDGERVAVDWEHSFEGVAGWDALHWMVQTQSLLARESPHSLVQRILDPGFDWGTELSSKQAQLLLRCYLLHRIAYTSSLNSEHGYDELGSGTKIGYWIDMVRVTNELR